MKRSKPTIKDVARRAGVSVATVSAVINERTGNVPLSKAARSKVRRAIRALDYRVNTQARTLRTGRSQTIGVIAGDLTQPFTGEEIRLIEQDTARRSYHFLLSDIRNNRGQEAFYLDLFRQKQVEGILMLGAACKPDAQAIAEIVAAGIPVVMTEREVKNPAVPCVLVDNVRGGLLATEHLIEGGHRRIACLAGPRGNVIARQRTQGYRKALRSHGLRQAERVVVCRGMELQDGHEAMTTLLQGGRPSGVVTFNDMIALGAMRAVREAALSVPEDISLVGYDDIPMASYCSPALTTIRQPLLEMCRQGIQLLFDVLEGKLHAESPRRVVLQPELIIRQSSTRLA